MFFFFSFTPHSLVPSCCAEEWTQANWWGELEMDESACIWWLSFSATAVKRSDLSSLSHHFFSTCHSIALSIFKVITGKKKKRSVGTIAQPVWGHISLLNLLVFANADVSLPSVLFYDASFLNGHQPGGGSTPYLRIPLLFFWSVVQGDWASWAYSLFCSKCIQFLLRKSLSRAPWDGRCCMLILPLLSGGSWLAGGKHRC